MLNLKNKEERVEFIKKYREWGVWKHIQELNLTFYSYDFKTGGAVIVTEYVYYQSLLKTCVSQHELCLILPQDDPYANDSPATGAELYKFYNPNGCSMGAIVDYMTKNKDVI